MPPTLPRFVLPDDEGPFDIPSYEDEIENFDNNLRSVAQEQAVRNWIRTQTARRSLRAAGYRPYGRYVRTGPAARRRLTLAQRRADWIANEGYDGEVPYPGSTPRRRRRLSYFS